MANKQQNPVAKLYQTVIDDVISNVRESFLDDGVDEQVLQELKQIWESKLVQTKAVDSPVVGDRTPRPQMYTYMAQPGQAGQPGQPVMYQTVPAQLSAASQQARLAIPDRVVYQQGTNIVLPTQGQQIYHTPYQPVTVLQQSNLQVPHQRLPGQTQTTIVLAPTSSQAGVSGQQKSASTGKSNPSAIIQVDGSKDSSSDEEGPSTSSSSTTISKSNVKLFPVKKKILQSGRKKRGKVILQVDGGIDSSSSDEDVEDDDDDDDEEDDEEEDTQEEEEEKVDEEPLCSADDDSDQDASELFDTDNVVVCQYDKIHRAKAKWKFNLKVGIMNLKGKDHVFLKANGEADW
ncbi:transcription initiation factor IIA subunit 1-like [Styela clava]